MSNLEPVLKTWAEATIVALDPVKNLLALEAASEADIKYAAKYAHLEMASHAFFGVNLQRLFDLPALEDHLRGLVGIGDPSAHEPAPTAPEPAKDAVPEHKVEAPVEHVSTEASGVDATAAVPAAPEPSASEPEAPAQ